MGIQGRCRDPPTAHGGGAHTRVGECLEEAVIQWKTQWRERALASRLEQPVIGGLHPMEEWLLSWELGERISVCAPPTIGCEVQFVGVQDISLDDLRPGKENLSPGQGGVEPVQGGWKPWHRAQEDTEFDLSPWEKLPALGEELQITRK
ncbi:hypothetical protein HGM15179_021270 [Zosterops borbonicus]|uniref:Uncharacterized protein n=1 Tax=Zosterops borbonicus TaxID=364589 RepID=A0A8K1D6A3_9PASS|nr:hypothetical protein HGM15179_021270 [Zosterops borbonicus]